MSADDASAHDDDSGRLMRRGQTLAGGRYVITDVLGAGGMAEVYAAEHTLLKKPVAIKVLLPVYSVQAEFRERFLREGLAASRIRHRHIVDVTDVGSDDDAAFLVMELLEGETLGALMKRERPLPIEQAVDLLLPIISALGQAHRHGIVHRDLKPENIFLATDAQGRPVPKVLDFGVSKVAVADDENRLTAVATVLGTPHYMSPEQACGDDDVDGASDQFSLAMVLFEAITGRLPYKSDTTLRLIHEVSRANIPLPSDLIAELAPADEMIRRATEREPRERYESIEAFGVALLPLASERARGEWSEALRSPPEVTAAVPKARKIPKARQSDAPATMASKGKSGARAIEPRTLAAKPASGARPAQALDSPEPPTMAAAPAPGARQLAAAPAAASDVVSPPEAAPAPSGSRTPVLALVGALLLVLLLGGGWWLAQGGHSDADHPAPSAASSDTRAGDDEIAQDDPVDTSHTRVEPGLAPEEATAITEEVADPDDEALGATAPEPAAAAPSGEATAAPGSETSPRARPRRPVRERPAAPAGGGDDELRLTR